MKTSMKTNEAAANLKGMAKHTYNRVMSAMAEDTTAAMLHTFAALTDGANAIALQSGKFSNLYIRGERKGMAEEAAAKELTERAAACVSRKLRKIDMVCAVAFLAEYISRQRKADEPTTEPTNNTPATMNANETTELGCNAATRAAMIDAARAFLVLADKLNEEVSAYIDGSDKPEAESAYNAVKGAEAEFLRYYCAYWDEPRRRPCLGYELAESSLPDDDDYFNGAA